MLVSFKLMAPMWRSWPPPQVHAAVFYISSQTAQVMQLCLLSSYAFCRLLRSVKTRILWMAFLKHGMWSFHNSWPHAFIQCAVSICLSSFVTSADMSGLSQWRLSKFKSLGQGCLVSKRCCWESRWSLWPLSLDPVSLKSCCSYSTLRRAGVWKVVNNSPWITTCFQRNKLNLYHYVLQSMWIYSFLRIHYREGGKGKATLPSSFRTGVSNSFSLGATSASQLPSKGRM